VTKGWRLWTTDVRTSASTNCRRKFDVSSRRASSRGNETVHLFNLFLWGPFFRKLKMYHIFNTRSGNPYWRGRIRTVDLLVQTRLVVLDNAYFTKWTTLMRRSTVLGPLPLQLVFCDNRKFGGRSLIMKHFFCYCYGLIIKSIFSPLFKWVQKVTKQVLNFVNVEMPKTVLVRQFYSVSAKNTSFVFICP